MGAFDRLKVLLGAAAVVSLAGCGGLGTGPSASPEGAYPYLLNLSISADQSPAAVAEAHGATVLDWRPEAGYALLGLQRPPRVLAQNATLEPNNRLVASGQAAWINGVTAWSTGRTAWSNGITAWSTGRTAWSNGSYQPIPQNTAPWRQIRLEQAQALAPNLGNGVKVAVIDTGIDLGHPAFQGSLAPSSEWRDFVGRDNVPQEEGSFGVGGYGHGTNVAGIILQVAPRATILPIRVLGQDGSGFASTVATGISYAVDAGARVINLSLGTSGRFSAITNAMNYAASRGVFVVTTAGNDNRSSINFPGSITNANTFSDNGLLWLNVTSVNASDLRSSFANYATNVEASAPGEQIFGPAPQNQLASWSGTSQAAPMASGALALALGQLDDLRPDIQTRQLADYLRTSARSHDWMAGNASFKGQLGMGVINLEEYLRRMMF